MSMEIDVFAEQSFGKAALKKMGEVSPNFRLYCAGRMGKPPDYSDTMEVKGCEFRICRAGPNKGKLSIPVPNTEKIVYVTVKEMDEFK